ncbi:MAG: proton-conducting membrane transporter [Clostridiales bacterium]|nr:proton-conducting membrane transporter [Clostridiales bacterium]
MIKAIAVITEVVLLTMTFWYVLTIGEHSMMTLLVNVPLPFGMALRIDRLSATMLLLNNFLFLCMIVYSLKRPYMNRLFIFLFLSLQGMINALFLSTDFFNVYILIEVATIAVSILIMYKKDSQSMYDGMIYLLVNMVAMGFFLLGIGYLYKTFGVLDFVTIENLIPHLENKRVLVLPFSFLITGLSLKAALMPLFSWLPKAHGTASAPAVVSAILSGIFVKVGIYLLIRMIGIFSFAIDLQDFFLFLGFLTALSGFMFAMAQSDIKLILAYHTVSQIGLILIGISGIRDQNNFGGIYHILSHGVFKSLFFLVSGILVQHYKTRKIKNMTGLWQTSKHVSIVLIFSILSITGAPLFSGGYSKYFISYGNESELLKWLFVVINAGTMASFIKFFRVIFTKPLEQAHKMQIDINQKIVISIMAAVCFLLGFAGDLVTKVVHHQPYTYDAVSQLSKLPIYLFSYLISYLVFRFILENSKALKFLKGIELSFNSINLAIVSFFFVTLAYLTITF